MDFGFLTESVQFPVWGFGFVTLVVVAAVVANFKVKENREVQ